MNIGPAVFKYMHFSVRTQDYKLVSPHEDPHHLVYQPKDQELRARLDKLELYEIAKDPTEREDLAERHPEIVEDLLLRYEDWYDDITQELEVKGIQHIHLGTVHQPKTNLSRFDWGGPRIISGNQYGFWRVITEPGAYEVKMTLPEIESDGTAHLKYQDIHLTQPVKQGQRQVVFENVKLPAAKGKFQAFLKIERLASGPLFVDVNRLDL